MIKFTFTLNKEDYIKSYQAFFFQERKLFLAGIVLFTLWSGFNIISLILQHQTKMDLFTPPIAFLLTGIILLIAILFISPAKAGETAEKDKRSSCPIFYEVTSQQLFFRTEFTQTRFFWEDFIKTVESKNHILLVHSKNKNCFQIIPKRAFATHEDEQSFKALLAQKGLLK